MVIGMDQPRIVLTNPSDGVANNGYDNLNGDLIVYTNDELSASNGRTYRVLGLLGGGAFGQVFEVSCVVNTETQEEQHFAMKISKGIPCYIEQASREAHVLQYVCIILFTFNTQ